MGKSTLAAYLLRNGWKVLSDDAMPVEVFGSRILVRPGAPHLKLTRRSAEHLCGESYSKAFDPNFEKWVVMFPEARGPSDLEGFILLSRVSNGPVRLERLKGARAALILQASFYNQTMRSPRVLERQFRLAVQLARLVPIWRLRYPTGFRNLRQAAAVLERCLNASSY